MGSLKAVVLALDPARKGTQNSSSSTDLGPWAKLVLGVPAWDSRQRANPLPPHLLPLSTLPFLHSTSSVREGGTEKVKTQQIGSCLVGGYTRPAPCAHPPSRRSSVGGGRTPHEPRYPEPFVPSELCSEPAPAAARVGHACPDRRTCLPGNKHFVRALEGREQRQRARREVRVCPGTQTFSSYHTLLPLCSLPFSALPFFVLPVFSYTLRWGGGGHRKRESTRYPRHRLLRLHGAPPVGARAVRRWWGRLKSFKCFKWKQWKTVENIGPGVRLRLEDRNWNL